MLSVKQGSIKYHFWSLRYDSTWNWTQISRGHYEHSNYYANVPDVYIYIYIYCFPIRLFKNLRFLRYPHYYATFLRNITLDLWIWNVSALIHKYSKNVASSFSHLLWYPARWQFSISQHLADEIMNFWFRLVIRYITRLMLSTISNESFFCYRSEFYIILYSQNNRDFTA